MSAPGPNAEFIGHAAVGLAGGKVLHAAVKPKTAVGAFFAWLFGAVAAIWAHAEFDLPVARLVTAAVPGIG